MRYKYLSRIAIWVGIWASGCLFVPSRAAVADVADPASREWTDSTGRFHMVGILIGADPDHARLQHTDGRVVTVPLARLSADDQQFVSNSLPPLDPAPAQSSQSPSSAPQAGPESTPPSSSSSSGQTRMVQEARQWWLDVASPSVRDVYRTITASPLLFASADPLPENMIYVRVSSRFLRRMAGHDVNRTGPVTDDILGAHVLGVSQTIGHTDFNLQPCNEAGLAQLHLFGTTNFNVIGYSGPVQIHTTGVTRFHAVKTIWIDSQGIHGTSAQTQASTASQINGIETSLPRLLGRISLRIAGNRSAQSHHLSDTITAEHTVRQVNRAFDTKAMAEFNDLWNEAGTQLAALSHKNPLRPSGLRATSTKDELQIVVLGGEGTKDRTVPAPVFAATNGDIEIQIHVAAIRTALVDAELSTILRPAIMQLTSMPRTRPGDAPAIHWSEDGKWLSVVWPGNENSGDLQLVQQDPHE